MTIDNPYWDAVKDCVEIDDVGGNRQPALWWGQRDRVRVYERARLGSRRVSRAC